jgi:acetyl esterase/lipase
MIHGGGHCLFTRKEVDPKQIRFMLDNGLVPVSVEYRFCPEVNILDGPMTDVCDALAWARTGLPQVRLNNPAVEVDASRVVVVGWSTGGHLALTLGYTPLLRGMQPPLAIFSLYPPSNYQDECTFSLH